MLVYLDSKDLITLVEGPEATSFDDAVSSLKAGNHKIVISFETVVEIAGPLMKSEARTNVMAFCARLEELPLSFLHEARVAPLELYAAIRAFDQRREFDSTAVYPFVERFDASIPLRGAAPTQSYINYGIAETVFDIWLHTPDVIGDYARHGNRLVDQMESDRRIPNPPTLENHFRDEDSEGPCALHDSPATSRCRGFRELDL